MGFRILKKKVLITLTMVLLFLTCFCVFLNQDEKYVKIASNRSEEKKIIKYVEFNANYKVLEKTMKLDIDSQKNKIKLNWIDMLAFLGAKYGGNFNLYKDQDLNKLVEKLKNGEKIEELAKNMKLFSYYKEAYGAILCEFLGKYKIQKLDPNSNSLVYVENYGIKVFSPIAKTFAFQHFKDFGSSRTYGFSRPHLGHDLMALIGTPVVAIESGIVETMGWNQYGGWRIGIRSFDRKRYYYYAHLRKNKPYQSDLKEKKIVKAGDVIGYVGRTGYSRNENVNNIDKSHLHVGLQLIFDESQKECNNEIWIDLYAITQLLQKNKCEVCRNNDTKEYTRKYNFIEELVEKNKTKET